MGSSEAGRHACSGFRSLSVNISPPEFRREDFLPSLKAAIREHGIDPTRLELEFTERILVEDPEAVARKLDAIKAMGIRISIDNFGNGCQSRILGAMTVIFGCSACHPSVPPSNS